MTSERDIAMAYREAIIELAGNIRDADRLNDCINWQTFFAAKRFTRSFILRLSREISRGM